ncbi:unnamed protein product [Rotaria sp. Silwood1]|nr:unnamed protein product [Rotaria sp. Silwood1]
MNTTKIGGFHRNFFPFVNQNGYRSPLVFVHFKKIETNVLINIECRAYARNIDHNDSLEFIRGGFHRNFFPFVNQNGYRSPLVFVHFKKIETNVLINIECRAYARNIDHNDSLEFIRGSVHFELIVE